MSELPAGAIVGHYRIEWLLGRGAVGEVYAARDERVDRRVALKIVSLDLIDSPRQRRRLYREGWLAAELDHPNICAIHEIGEADGRAFVAMEYVSGVTLDVYARQEPFDADRALRIAIQLARAMHAAHSHHVVHRDLKSTNIVVTADGQVKVLDFGLAIRTGTDPYIFETGAPRPLPSGVGVGTADYASPEQILGAAIDARSDLFSFGVVLHEMLTGRLPFSGENRTELFRAIVNNRAMPVDELNDAVPVALSNVVGRLLAKQREQRYQTAEAVLADLESIERRGHAASGRPPRWTDSRWFHRIAGSAAGLVLAVGGLFPASVVVSHEAEAALRSTAAQQSGVWIGLAAGRTMDAVVTATEWPDSVWIGNDGRLVYSTSGLSSRSAVWTLGPGDLAPRLVAPHGSQPSVTPAGDAVIFAGPDRGLYRSSLDGRLIEPLMAAPAMAPRVVPDGTAVVFRHAVTGHVWLLPLDGSGPARPLTTHAIDAAPLVSPDGRRLAFEHGGQTRVCDLPDCVNERRLPIAALLGWTPDGRGLAYAGRPRQANVWIAPVDGGQSKQVTWFSGRTVTSVAWSPDGRRLAVARVMTLADLELLAAFR